LLLLAARAFAAPSPTGPSSPDEVIPDDIDDIDEEVARSAIDAGTSMLEDSLGVTSGLVDVTSLAELEARHQRPSAFGRLDLVIAWRRIDREVDRMLDLADVSPATSQPSDRSRRDEVWLLATWRN